MILPLEIKQFESIDPQNFLAREARRNFVTSLGPKAPQFLPNLVKSHENFVWDKNLSKYKGGSKYIAVFFSQLKLAKIPLLDIEVILCTPTVV